MKRCCQHTSYHSQIQDTYTADCRYVSAYVWPDSTTMGRCLVMYTASRLKRTHIRKALSAAVNITLMWLLARMRSFVDSQGASLDELFVATRVLAGVRPLVRMDAKMPRKIRLAIEHLWVTQIVKTSPVKKSH